MFRPKERVKHNITMQTMALSLVGNTKKNHAFLRKKKKLLSMPWTEQFQHMRIALCLTI